MYSRDNECFWRLQQCYTFAGESLAQQRVHVLTSKCIRSCTYLLVLQLCYMLFPSPHAPFPANAGCSAVCSQVISPVMRWCLCLGERGERPGQCSGREYKCTDWRTLLSLNIEGSSRLFQRCCVRDPELQTRMHFWGWIMECFCLYSFPLLLLTARPNRKKRARKTWNVPDEMLWKQIHLFAGSCLIARDCSSYFEKVQLPLEL